MKKINIAELLKDCPKGMELDSPVYYNLTFDYINEEQGRIYCKTDDRDATWFTIYGCVSKSPNAKCVIFPKGKTTLDGFHRPFKDGDIVFYNDTISIFKEWGDETLFRAYVCTYLYCEGFIDKNIPLFGKSIRKEIRLATEDEKEELFKAIKDNGYRWNAETKTLENLEVKKFDINTLVPFDKVLVRDSDKDMWCASIFSHTCKDKYFCVGTWHNQCIPYEANKELLGTTNDYNEFYKTWK